MQAMKLEIQRLRLNLSAAERDRALLSISIDPATIDPNRLLDDSYMVKLCNHADSLASLGQAAHEDQINASIGLETTDERVLDFWNINEFGETCCGAKCEVRAEKQPSSKASSVISSTTSSPLLLICSQCGKKSCRVCCAGKGANLLISNNYKDMRIYSNLSSQSGSNQGGQNEGTCSSQSALVDGVICKLCCNEVILLALYVDYVRVLSSLRRRARADDAAHMALDQAVGHEVDRISNSWRGVDLGKKQLKKLLKGAESLAEFPHATILHLVISQYLISIDVNY